MLSVIIPTLTAGSHIAATLGSIPKGLAGETIVSDGGSGDDTAAVARRHGAQVVTGPAGRGAQLSRGASEALGDWYLFLHADTRLSDGAEAAVRAFMDNPENKYHAGVFRFRLDDRGFAPRLVEAGAALRTRMFKLPYGDQGLLISRDLYHQVGGFRPLPLMEDVDMARRLRKRIRVLPAAAITSARRYQSDGYLKRVTRNLSCLLQYFMGRDPALIKKRYEA